MFQLAYLLLTSNSRFNSHIAANRRRNLNGVYEPHTNTMHYPATMQPTHARWEALVDGQGQITGRPGYVNSSKTAMITETANDDKEGKDENGSEDTIFLPVEPVYAKNFLIVDTVYENPLSSHLGPPGPADDTRDVGFNGLSTVTDEVLAELPPDCRTAFEKSLSAEKDWKAKWSTESVDALRRAPIIDKGLIM